MLDCWILTQSTRSIPPFPLATHSFFPITDSGNFLPSSNSRKDYRKGKVSKPLPAVIQWLDQDWREMNQVPKSLGVSALVTQFTSILLSNNIILCSTSFPNSIKPHCLVWLTIVFTGLYYWGPQPNKRALLASSKDLGGLREGPGGEVEWKERVLGNVKRLVLPGPC